MTRFIFFFFSSRRRHTRCSRDWSSDVCSSDLVRSDTDLGPEAVPHAARLATDARQAGLPPQIYLRGVADLRAALTHALGPMYRVEREVRPRSEEHTSELQSRLHLVCRLLLEKK